MDENKAEVTAEAPNTKPGKVYQYWETVFNNETGEDDATYRERNAMLVAALRSDRFTQTKSVLQRIEWNDGLPEVVGQCCLGVACLVGQAAGLPIAPLNRNYNRSSEWLVMGDDDDARVSLDNVAPKRVYEWFGWRDGNPNIWDAEGFNRCAATRNDSGDEDFAAIADAFEYTFVNYTVEPQPVPQEEEPSTVDPVMPAEVETISLQPDYDDHDISNYLD